MLRFVFLFLFFAPSAQAAHIVGGYMTYDIIGIENNLYEVEITLELYRNPYGGGAEFDQDLEIGVYLPSEGYTYVIKSERLKPVSVNTVQWQGEGNNEDEIQVGQYKVVFELEARDYVFTYQRCCRESDLINIFESNDTGIQCRLDLFEEAFLNESHGPKKNSDVIHKVLVNEIDTIDISFTDEDDLTYEFVAAFSAGGTAGATSPGNFSDCDGVKPAPQNCPPTDLRVIYNSLNFAASEPFGYDSAKLDVEEGWVEVEINEPGKFLMNVLISEERDGVLLSKTYYESVASTISFVSLVEESNEDGLLKVLPNPASTSIALFSESYKAVELVDVSGRLYELPEIAKIIDVSSLSSGMFILKVMNPSGKIRYLKFLKI